MYIILNQFKYIEIYSSNGWVYRHNALGLPSLYYTMLIVYENFKGYTP